MPPVHSGGEVPWTLGIKSVTYNDFSHSIGSALLEVVTICYPVIIMANPAGLLGAVRRFAVYGELIPVGSS